MSRFYKAIDPQFKEFVDDQKMFFVATAPAQGRVNLSPKGMDTFRVLGPNRVSYLDLTGSGNETAAHVLENGRITFMFISLGRQPMILRMYGTARIVQPRDADWATLLADYPELPGVRQIFLCEISELQTSCGFGVPEYELKRERPTLNTWAVTKGEEGLAEYWEDNNLESIDGLATGLDVDR